MDDVFRKALDEIRQSANRIAKAEEAQLRVWNGEKVDRQPLLLHCVLTSEEQGKFPPYTYREVYERAEANLNSQIPAMLSAVRGGGEAVPSARANCGCGIFASFFGLTQTLFDDKMPWLTEHLLKDVLKEKNAADLFPGRAFENGLAHMKVLSEGLAGTGARVFPMDLQGPVDLAHLIYGNDFFYDLYDDPGFIGHLLNLCVESCTQGATLCMTAIPGADHLVAHYNELVLPRNRGVIKTSEDTTTLLSGNHIRTMAVPAMVRMLERLGGGYVHYCGRNDHLLTTILREEKVYGVNFGNPERHDMEDVIRRCADAGKIYYGLVTRSPGEGWEPYFTRLLKASLREKRKHLLLRVRCTWQERLEVIDAWDRANIVTDQVLV